MRIGGRSRTAVPEERVAEFVHSVAVEGGALPPPTPPASTRTAARVKAATPPAEKTREIHVRIPLSLHKQLAYAAVDRETSLTQLAAYALAVGLRTLRQADGETE